MAVNFPRFVVFEGCDGTGKTTLINDVRMKLFHDHTMSRVYDFGAFTGQRRIAQHYAAPMIAAINDARRSYKNDRKVTLFDRSWFAEPIYGAVMREGDNRIDRGNARMLERLMLTLNGVLVITVMDEEQVIETFNSRHDKEYPKRESQIRELLKQYLSLSRSAEMYVPTIAFAYRECEVIKSLSRYGVKTCVGVDDLMLRLSGLARTENIFNTALLDRPGCGAWSDTSTLVVAERSSDPSAARYPWLTLVNRFGTRMGCGAWFAEQLEDIGVGERRLYFVNAVTPDGDWLDPMFIDRLLPSRVVTLGEVARSWAIANNLDHRPLKHPRYIKRFFHNVPWSGLSSAFK